MGKAYIRAELIADFISAVSIILSSNAEERMRFIRPERCIDIFVGQNVLGWLITGESLVIGIKGAYVTVT